MYVLGQTTASDFPTTSGAYQTTPTEGSEIFVSKVNSTTNQLVYSTYLRSTNSGDDEASAIRVNSSGQAYIVGSTDSTSFPTTSSAYQTTSGSNTGRNAFFTLLNASGNGLVYSTYLAGNGDDQALSLALYPSGTATPTVYIAGVTASTNFPTTSGAYQSANRGGADGFFAKLNPQASGSSSLVYATYVGGTATDKLTSVGVVTTTARAGQAALVGLSYSTNFTTTGSAYQSALRNAGGGTPDAVIALIDPAVSGASGLKYASYYGGDSSDEATAGTVDVNGKLYLYGTTSSSNLTVTAGVVQSSLRGSQDTFAIKVDPDASGSSSLSYATYLGGTANEGSATSMVVGTLGSVVLAGWTASSNLTTTSGAYQTASGGGVDGFISVLNPTATSLSYSTYLGGSANEEIAGATSQAGVLYLAGWTASSNFPVKGGGISAALSGGTDAFVTALGTGGLGTNDLKYSSYLGGSNVEENLSVAVDATGAAYVTGQTYSTAFPTTTGSYRELAVGGGDAFVTKLTPDGSGVVYSTYLGGTSQDLGKGVTIDSAGNAYVAGQTKSPDFPISTTIQSALGGNYDVFATKLNPTGSALLYSTYLGGNGSDNVLRQLVVDSAGRLYLAGTNASSNYSTTTQLGSTPVSGTDKVSLIISIAQLP